MDKKWFLLALQYLKYRPRSKKEIRDYLKKKQAPVEEIEKIITTLANQKFLNDEEFAQKWIKTRNALKPTGKRLLTAELTQKGIDKQTIEKVLKKTQEESGTDLEIARILIEKKKEKYKTLPRDEIYRKLGSFLSRRGFDYGTVKRSIDEVFGE